MLTELSGQIERITYTNEENGYTIARVKIFGQRDLVTVVGFLMSPTPGEILNMRGEWVNHPKFGEQFKVVDYKTAVPATVFGIQKYLGSGLIKGLGPAVAMLIVVVAWQIFRSESTKTIQNRAILIAALSAIAFWFNLPSPLVLLGAGIMGVILFR